MSKDAGEAPRQTRFEAFARGVSEQVSQAWFFSACVLLIVVWIPTIWLLPFDVSQLLVNTATTIVTFLLVALLQNTDSRTSLAINHKLDRLLESNALVLDQTDGMDESGELARDLRAVAGVEMETQRDA